MTDTVFDYDLFVIGGGSGGVRAARIAAGHGARVAIAEEYRMGGTCVIRGCVPKKFMVYASDFARQIEAARGYGWRMDNVEYDHAHFSAAMHSEVDRLSGLYKSGQKNAGVEVFETRAELTGPHSVVLRESGREITAEKILIAVGGRPWRPMPEVLPGVEHTITSNEIFMLERLPNHIVIIGGGYIAVEFAHIFAGLGVKTCLVYRRDTVLRGFDGDVRTIVHEGLIEAGVQVITHANLTRVELRESGGKDGLPFRASLDTGIHIDADVIMMATGRVPLTEGLGCEVAGVALGAKNEVVVDEWSRTNVPNIWAVGDVTDRVALTPVAIREGHAFADTEFGGKAWKMDHKDIPSAVFSQPEVGTVGLSEVDARKAHGEIDIYKSDFRPMKNAISGSAVRVFMKIIVRREDQRVLGVHIVGDHAAEMVQTVAIAVKMGATKEDFDRTCALHPSVSEELVTMRTKYVDPALA